MTLRNKKASSFEVALVLIAFVSLSYAMGSFMFVKEKIKIEASPNSELTNMYNQRAEDIYYDKEMLSLNAQQKLYDLAKEGAVSGVDCNIRSAEYVEWNENCKPDTEILKEVFVTEIKKNETKTTEENGYVKYKVEYNYDYIVSVKLEDLGIYPEEFSIIYEQANNCKKNEKIEDCMNLKRWSIKTKKDSGYILFDLSTKKNFFFDGKFEPIILKFAVKE